MVFMLSTTLKLLQLLDVPQDPVFNELMKKYICYDTAI